MTRLCPVLLASLALLAGIETGARAEPAFAQREGLKCGRCHVNRTGGGKRTAFGHLYGRTHLSLFASRLPADPQAAARAVRAEGGFLSRMFDPQLNDFVSVGANLRLGNSTVFGKKETHNTLSNPEANFYLELDLGPHVMAYADVSVAEGNVEAREAFALLAWRSLYLKGGYLMPPYGLRIWGDEEFVRKETGYNYAAPDLALELGYDGERLTVALAVSNGAGGGPDSDAYKRLSALAELAWPAIRVGLSGSYNRTSNQSAIFGGMHLGLSLGRVTLLGELDLLTTLFHQKNDRLHALVAYGELDLLILRGLNLKVGYGFHDPALDIPEDQRLSLRAGLELFPMPFVAVSLFYTLRQSVPQDEVGNADTLLAELHLYF